MKNVRWLEKSTPPPAVVVVYPYHTPPIQEEETVRENTVLKPLGPYCSGHISMVNIRCHKIDKVSPCGPEPKMQTILAVWSACVQVRNCRPFCKHWKLPKCQLSRPVLFRSILALSKPYRSHCLNGTGLLATKCSKSTTAKNYHQEITHILNSFYSCSCYHFIPAAVIISFLQLF